VTLRRRRRAGELRRVREAGAVIRNGGAWMTIARHYDPRCREVAEHFLLDDPRALVERQREERRVSLALAIQQAIEDWFEDHPLPKEFQR